MKNPADFFFWLSLLVLITAPMCVWFWFVVCRPEKWARWVEKENDFMVRHRLSSVAYAERSKRWEKGLPMKLMAGSCALLGIGGIMFSLYLLIRSGYLTK